MQTSITEALLAVPAGRTAEPILRACVHCGFCLATCPTYQLLGSELDSPRGRIYLVKQLLEGRPAGARTRLHLDRCLTCRSCETTCPSGVSYGRLLDIGRELVERQAPRPLPERLFRRLLRGVLAHRRRFALLLAVGRTLQPLLPRRLARTVPTRPPRRRYSVSAGTTRNVLLIEGCVQPVLRPATDAAAAALFARLGVRLYSTRDAGCCGAIDHHLAATGAALERARRNVDAWCAELDGGRADALLVNASGCGQMIRDYGQLLKDDPAYAARATRVAAAARDPAELLAECDLGPLGTPGAGMRIAFHSPCTLQHGLRLGGVTERLLGRLGFELLPVADPHLCCGSAGTYALLQPGLSERLREAKLRAVESGDPEVIATANIGCQHHLQAATGRPVLHWLELLADRLER